MKLYRSDFIQVLSTLSKAELNFFSLYLKKTFSSGSLPIRLFNFLKKYYPEFPELKVNYQNAFKALYPDRTYKITTVQNTLSDLLIALRTFLTQQYLDAHPYEQHLLWLKVYQQRQLHRKVDLQLKKMNKSLDGSLHQDIWHYLKKMRLDHERYYYPGTKQYYQKNSLIQAQQHLDKFYIDAKLKYIAESYNRYNQLNEELSLNWLEYAILSSDKQTPSSFQTPFTLVVKLLRDQEESIFYELKNWLNTYGQILVSRDGFILLTYMLNYTSRQIRLGHKIFVNEAFSMYQFGIDHGFLLVNDWLSPTHYLNAVELAGKLNRYDWAEKFILQYSIYLPAEQCDYYINYARARLAFKMKNFKDCFHWLESINLKQPQDKPVSQWLSIMTLYEMNCDYDFLTDKILAFEKSIRNNKLISTEKKKGIKTTIKALRLLLHPNPGKTKLKRLLESNNELFFRGWLEEKIDLL